jgi:hypothetical protein
MSDAAGVWRGAEPEEAAAAVRRKRDVLLGRAVAGWLLPAAGMAVRVRAPSRDLRATRPAGKSGVKVVNIATARGGRGNPRAHTPMGIQRCKVANNRDTNVWHLVIENGY